MEDNYGNPSRCNANVFELEMVNPTTLATKNTAPQGKGDHSSAILKSLPRRVDLIQLRPNPSGDNSAVMACFYQAIEIV